MAVGRRDRTLQRAADARYRVAKRTARAHLGLDCHEFPSVFSPACARDRLIGAAAARALCAGRGRALRHQHGASATHRGRPNIQTHHRQAPMAQTSSSTPHHVRPAPPALPRRPRHARSAPRSRGSSGAVGVNSVAGRSGRAGWAGRLPGTDDAPAQRRWRTAPYARRSTGVHLILQRRGPDLWLNLATRLGPVTVTGYANRLRGPCAWLR